MKECIFLYRSKVDNYLPLDKKWENSLSILNYLLLTDFRPWDEGFLHQDVNLYNANFIYHDFANKMLYIGFGDWLIDEEIDGPSSDEFFTYVKQIKTCSILVENFIEFKQKWIALKQALPSFAVMSRDDNDWVDCKGFDSKEEMELFVKNYQPEIAH